LQDVSNKQSDREKQHISNYKIEVILCTNQTSLRMHDSMVHGEGTTRTNEQLLIQQRQIMHKNQELM